MDPTDKQLSIERQMVGNIYTSVTVMDMLAVLCDDVGPRFGGTEAERRGAEYIAETFKRYGLSNVHLEPFQFDGWSRGEAKLEIIYPVSRTIPCISLPYTPACEVEGDIIKVGGGTEADYEHSGAKLKGNFALVLSRLAQGQRVLLP
jgi:Iap family predicted aminopeptidase